MCHHPGCMWVQSYCGSEQRYVCCVVNDYLKGHGHASLYGSVVIYNSLSSFIDLFFNLYILLHKPVSFFIPPTYTLFPSLYPLS